MISDTVGISSIPGGEDVKHMLIAPPLELLLGPFQFMSSIRAKALRVHRYIGHKSTSPVV